MEIKKVLYGTTNKSKITNMKCRLIGLPIEIVTLSDLDIKIDVEEDGLTVEENALKKATAYYNATKIPTISGDSSLYIEKFSPDKQPGLFVRRINGKYLDDDQLVDYYIEELNKVGGQSNAYYFTGLAFVDEKGSSTISIKQNIRILTSSKGPKKYTGNPLDIISIDPITGKYHTELTNEDRKNKKTQYDIECIEFIKKNIIR